MKPVEIEFLMKDGVSGPMSKIEGSATSMAGRVVSESSRVESALKKVGFAVGAYFTLDYAKSFAQSMVKVRGEIESLQISFETLAGKATGEKLFAGIKDWVVSTPMLMQDAAKGAQTLLAFNVEAEKVLPILKQIGDISMGDAQKFNSLTLAFAQMSSTGKLMGQDLLQMINAGFNPLTVIAEKTGKSIAQLKDDMANGAISSQMVADAFASATAEGGKFHGMLEKQSKGIQGSLSNLQGAIDDMFNDMGTKNQGYITDAINVATTLVKHYEDIGRVLTVLIATYGAYKAALLTTVAIQKASALADNIKLVTMFRKELGLLTAAQQAFNIKALANPYILLATAIIGACAAVWQIVSAKQAEAEAIEDAIKPMREEFTQTNLLIGKLKDSTLAEKERKAILEELKQVNPDIVKGIENESTAYEELSKRLEAYNKAKLAEIAIKKFSLKDDFDDAVTELSEARDALQSESAGIIDVYSTLFARFKEMETSGKEIPADLKTLFNSIIDSSAPETEKVESLFAIWDKFREKVRNSHRYAQIPEASVMNNLFVGLDISDYKDALEEVSDATDEYEQKATTLKGKIDNIAKSIYTDEKERQDFIMSQWAVYFPDEVKKVETAIDGTSEKTSTWKDDIKDLVGEEYKANIDAATNINEVVEFIQKQIKSEKEKVDNMKPLLIKAGFDFSTMSFPAPLLPSEYNTQLQAEYTKSANALTGLQTAQKKLNIPNGAKSTGDAVTDKIKTQIELVKSAREEYNQLLKVMSSDAAYAAILCKLLQSPNNLKDIILSDKEGDGYVNYLNGIVSELSKRKTKEAKDLVAKLQKEIDTINLDKAYDAEVRRYESVKQNKEYTKSVSEQVRQSQFDIRQSEIDAMDEGFDKELAAIGLNYDKLISENEKRQQEWIKQLTDARKAQWLLDNPDKEEAAFNLTFDIANLTPEQQQALQEYTAMANRYKENAEADLLKNLLGKYRNYEQQRIEINKIFDAERRAIENGTSTEAEKTAALIMLEQKRGEAIKQVNNEEVASMQKSSDLLVNLFSDASQRSVRELQSIISATKELMSYLENTDSKDIAPQFGFTAEELKTIKESPEKLKALRAALKELNDELSTRSPFQKFGNDVESAIAKLKKGDIGGGLEGIGGAMQSIMPTVKKFGNDLSTIFGDSQIGEDVEILTTLIGGVGEGIAGIGKLASGDILGGITSIVSGLASIFEMASAAEKKHQEALEQIARNRIALQREHNLLLLEQNLLMKEATSIFGEQSIAKAIRSVEVYKEAIKQFNAELKGDKPSMDWFESMTGDMLGSYKKRMDDYNAGIGALNQISVKTGHEKTGLFGWGKGRDIYTSLLNLPEYKDLIEASGRLDIEMAKTILNNEQMSEANKALLQSLIDLQEQADAAQEQLRDYLQNTFGDLGAGAIDALVAAIRDDGVDAWEEFGKAGSKTIEKLGEQLVYSLFFAKKFEQLQKDLEKIYGSGKSEKEIAQDAMNLIGDFYNGLGSTMDDAQGFMEGWQTEAEKHGFDLWGKDDQTAQSGSAGAFTTMTQEQGTKLEGLFTSVQMHVANIDDQMGYASDTMYSALEVLREISESVYFCKHLKDIKDDINFMRTNGVKMK